MFFLFPTLSCLTCLGWGESLTSQDSFVIIELIDSKCGLGKCVKKIAKKPLSEVLYASICCITSAMFASKLNMWCLVVISLGFVRRGAISMIGKTSGQLSLGAGTGENALGNPKGLA